MSVLSLLAFSFRSLCVTLLSFFAERIAPQGREINQAHP